jgi:hypothetical protein
MKALVAAGLLCSPVSCLKDMPESADDLPQSLQWNPDLAFPLGADSFGLNEASGFDTARWDPDTITGLPRWVSQLEVEMTGTVPVDLSSLSQDIDHVNRVLFRINLYNGFPHEAMAQAYFTDLDGNRIDSMFGSGPVAVNPGGVVGNGESIDPAMFRRDVVYNKEQVRSLAQAVEIRMQAVFAHPDVDTALIPFYANYHFDVDVGIMASITIDF